MNVTQLFCAELKVLCACCLNPVTKRHFVTFMFCILMFYNNLTICHRI